MIELDEVAKRQLAWGVAGAKKWFPKHGFAALTAAPTDEMFPSLLATKQNGEEAMVNVLAHATIFTNAARDAMYRTVDWKKEKPGFRVCTLFVPTGLEQAARDALGLFDHYVEYEYI